MRTLKTIIAAGLFAALTATAAMAQGGSFTLTGDEAAGYAAPSDTTLVRSMRMERFGLTYERYQQTYEGANVLGGQVTIHRDDDGTVMRVIGAHYPDIAATNSVRVTAAGAHGLVDRDIGPDGERDVTLMIDPDGGRLFWRVETRRAANRWVHWIGAESGQTLNKFDALTNACTPGTGKGVAFDRDSVVYADDEKNLDCLITPSGSGTRLVTDDGRQETHDQGSTRRPFLGPIATDSDEFWDIPGRESPGTGALVDAHYYIAHAEAYIRNTYGFDFTDAGNHNGPIVVHGHYTKNYVNAFWNGSYFAFGDGDGVNYDPLSSMDVAAHEFTHGVTEYTSDLIYQNESGALNESFSDIMAAVIERLSDATVLTPEPDGSLALAGSEWTVGEDFDLNGDGFRNMANPAADGDPAHYDDRYTGTGDNGGVHINSGISNHAFYKLVVQQVVDVQRAADIFYLGYTGLTSNADFCDARDATILVAGAEVAQVTTVWDEVGVNAALCDGGVVDLQPTAADDNATTDMNVQVVIDVLANDDLGDEPTTITSVDTTGTLGAVANNGNSITYTPPLNSSGLDDTFTYTIIDIDGDTSTALVTVTVNEPAPPGTVDVLNISPASMDVTDSPYAVTITGNGFGSDKNDVSVTFINGSGPAPTATVDAVADDTINVFVSAKVKGKKGQISWDVVVTTSNGSDSLPQVFDVIR